MMILFWEKLYNSPIISTFGLLGITYKSHDLAAYFVEKQLSFISSMITLIVLSKNNYLYIVIQWVRISKKSND